jgi:hypothetical protein
VGVIVDRGELGKGSPATANIEQLLALLELDLLADNGELVVLELLKGLLLVDIGDNARGVDHAWAQEPAVEVIAAVVVVADLLLILGASVHDDLWCELEENELEQAGGEAEAGPVGSVLHDLKAVAVELDIAVKVQVVEGLHWDLVAATILQPVGLVLEGKVVLDRAAGVLDLLILAWPKAGRNSPECQQDWDGGKKSKEDGRLEASANLPGKVGWDDEEQPKEDGVGEAVRARSVGRKRRVGNCWVL